MFEPPRVTAPAKTPRIAPPPYPGAPRPKAPPRASVTAAPASGKVDAKDVSRVRTMVDSGLFDRVIGSATGEAKARLLAAYRQAFGKAYAGARK